MRSGVPRVDELDRVQNGEVLVADITDPDWEPAMRRAAAIVTDKGGRTAESWMCIDEGVAGAH